MYLPYFKINAVSSFPIVEYRIEKPNGEPFEGTDWQESPEFLNVIPVPTGTNYIVLKAKDEQGCIASYEFYTGVFYMRVVGGRTQGMGVMASWYTTQLAESQIDWAITQSYSPPNQSEYQTTEWNNNFTNYHELSFPEIQMNAYHWFFARSRSQYGRVVQSTRRGLYVVPSEFSLDSDFVATPETELVVVKSFEFTSNNLRTQYVNNNNKFKFDEIVTEFSFTPMSITGFETENSNLRTNVIIYT